MISKKPSMARKRQHTNANKMHLIEYLIDPKLNITTLIFHSFDTFNKNTLKAVSVLCKITFF